MVMRITKFASVSAASKYYTSLHGQDEQLKGVERSGQLQGRAAEWLEIENAEARKDIFETLANGRDPRDNSALIQTMRGRKTERIPGWDITFSPDKSVSVAWAAAPVSVAQEIERAQREASQVAMAYLEQNFAMTRSGAKGTPEHVAGLVWSRHDHFLSRALDPQLHTHNFVFNMALKDNGRFGAIHSREMYKGVQASQTVYRAELADRLERIGFRLHKHSGNNFAITGIREDVLSQNSNRRQQILEATQDYQHKSSRSFENAAIMTRNSKVKTDVGELLNIWQERNDKLGFTAEKVSKMVAPTQAPQMTSIGAALVKVLEKKTGHTHTLGAVAKRALPLNKGTLTHQAANKAAGKILGALARQGTRAMTQPFIPGRMLRTAISAGKMSKHAATKTGRKAQPNAPKLEPALDRARERVKGTK